MIKDMGNHEERKIQGKQGKMSDLICENYRWSL